MVHSSCSRCLEEWSPELRLKKLIFPLLQFGYKFTIYLWIVRLLPNARRIGNQIGEYIFCEGDDKSKVKIGKFIQIRVSIQVMKPLKTGLFLNHPDGSKKLDLVQV